MSPVTSQAHVSRVGYVHAYSCPKSLLVRDVETFLGQIRSDEQTIAHVKDVMAKADQLAMELEKSQKDLKKVEADNKQLQGTATDMHRKFGILGVAIGGDSMTSVKKNNVPGSCHVMSHMPLPRVPLFPTFWETDLNTASPQPPPPSTETSQSTLINQERPSVERLKLQTVANQPKSPSQTDVYFTKVRQLAAEVAKSHKDVKHVEVDNKKLYEAAMDMHRKFGKLGVGFGRDPKTGAKTNHLPNSGRARRQNPLPTVPLFPIFEEPDENDAAAESPSPSIETAQSTFTDGDNLQTVTTRPKSSLRADAGCFVPPPPGLSKQWQ